MSSRLLTAPICVVLSVLGFVFLIPDCASACSCAGGPGPPADELSYADAVFSGEVVDFDKSPPRATATVRVSEVWKGPKQQTIEITTPSDGVMCGYPFKEGQEYLVYAYGAQGPKVQVELCSTTKALSKAGADLAVLGEGEKPTDGDEVLSDTSGGVSAGALVGVAWLVMAASLLLVARLVRTG